MLWKFLFKLFLRTLLFTSYLTRLRLFYVLNWRRDSFIANQFMGVNFVMFLFLFCSFALLFYKSLFLLLQWHFPLAVFNSKFTLGLINKQIRLFWNSKFSLRVFTPNIRNHYIRLWFGNPYSHQFHMFLPKGVSYWNFTTFSGMISCMTNTKYDPIYLIPLKLKQKWTVFVFAWSMTNIMSNDLGY